MIDAPAPYVWLAPANASGNGSEVAFVPRRVSEADDARVRAWAEARGAVFTPPAAAPTLETLDASLALALAGGIEGELAKAREALAALDVASLESALARAETTLRAHPELSQAAWLRAEVERGWASRYARAEPRDEARAARAWKRAAALDGGRVAGIGETSFGAADMTAVALTYKPAPGLEVRIDGKRVAPGTVQLAEAEHQVVAFRSGRPIWATWAGVAKGAVLTLPDFAPAACSADDFAAVRGARGRSGSTESGLARVSASEVACPRWFVVLGGDSIAQCRGGTCGPFVTFAPPSRAQALASTPPARDDHPHAAQSRWVTWGAVGLGLLITSGSLMVASGVFDKPARESRWVSGGLRPE